jgi:gamma-glutamylcyclotransferase (GGCT)/AIG2-like uncharacterized protein YtfP
VPEQKVYVFVYGTLRKNEPNHSLLSSARMMSRQSWMYGALYDTGLGYPVMLRSSEERVYGECYYVSEKQLHALDELEGYKGEGEENLYTREIHLVHTDSGVIEAYVYINSSFNIHSLKKIPHGDWKIYRLVSQPSVSYFAYGSCMDDERFKKAKVEHLFHDLIGRGVLSNYSLRYTRVAPDGGRADLVEGGGRIEGKVYRIGHQTITYLYRREGVDSRIYRPTVVDIKTEAGTLSDVLTFVVVDKQKETAPPEWYAREIIRGGSGTLSKAYISRLCAELQTKFNIMIRL